MSSSNMLTSFMYANEWIMYLFSFYISIGLTDSYSFPLVYSIILGNFNYFSIRLDNEQFSFYESTNYC